MTGKLRKGLLIGLTAAVALGPIACVGWLPYERGDGWSRHEEHERHEREERREHERREHERREHDRDYDW